MANELSLSLSVNFSKGGATLNKNFSASITVAGDVPHYSVQIIGTSEEAITFPSDMSAVGYVVLKNLDDTDYVQVGRTTGVYTARIPPGEFCLFRLDTGTEFFAKADTATCSVEKILIEV